MIAVELADITILYHEAENMYSKLHASTALPQNNLLYTIQHDRVLYHQLLYQWGTTSRAQESPLGSILSTFQQTPLAECMPTVGAPNDMFVKQ